jgi:hypothetical protein
MLAEKMEEPVVAVDAPGTEPDQRFQLVERIIATAPFQKSQRFRDLLRYLTEKSIHGKPGDLTETTIGMRVFNRPADYSPVEDSTVRVHIRQLRLKLHEYFDSEGRDEPLILEIPKGGFMPVFRPATQRAYDKTSPETPSAAAPPAPGKLSLVWLLAAVSILLALTCSILVYRMHAAQASRPTQWPLNAIFSADRPTNIVVGDVNHGIHDMMTGKVSTLPEYLDEGSQIPGFSASDPTGHIAELMRYIKSSSLTSYADAVVVSTLTALASQQHARVEVRPAHEMHLRDFEEGNFILLGSSASDPWVYLFEGRLNFTLTQDPATKTIVWLNKDPQPGEQAFYQGLVSTGSSGEEYADISLLPSQNGQGNVLIIQGMQQEGTEAAGRYLADPASRDQLRKLLHDKGAANDSPYFEALLKSTTVAGAPTVATVVAVRSIPGR